MQQEWKCDVRRIWREIDVLRLCGEILGRRGPGTGDQGPGQNTSEQLACDFARVQPIHSEITVRVPEILFEDRDNYCYAMTAAPEGHRTWKEMLLAGEIDPEIAIAAGRLLGTLHAATWQDKRVAELLGDRSYFEALRVEPYFQHIADRNTEYPDIRSLIFQLRTHQWCLVHGDFSPKNLLFKDGKLVLIDFEVGHFGDPAFDIGFFLSHLILKGVAR